MVRAVFKFKGTNNDEVISQANFHPVSPASIEFSLQLKFKKGDLITITQSEDGGWWEGTLDGKTGWFPSNYVEKVDKDPKAKEPGVMTEEVLAKNVDYRQQVISDMLEKEQEFVSELRVLHDQYLQPLHHADM